MRGLEESLMTGIYEYKGKLYRGMPSVAARARCSPGLVQYHLDKYGNLDRLNLRNRKKRYSLNSKPVTLHDYPFSGINHFADAMGWSWSKAKRYLDGKSPKYDLEVRLKVADLRKRVG